MRDSPIDVSDGPEVLEYGLGEQVPYLRPYPRRLLDGSRQEILRLFIRNQLHEFALQLWR